VGAGPDGGSGPLPAPFPPRPAAFRPSGRGGSGSFATINGSAATSNPAGASTPVPVKVRSATARPRSRGSTARLPRASALPASRARTSRSAFSAASKSQPSYSRRWLRPTCGHRARGWVATARRSTASAAANSCRARYARARNTGTSTGPRLSASRPCAARLTSFQHFCYRYNSPRPTHAGR
jgi:hypothetical protein